MGYFLFRSHDLQSCKPHKIIRNMYIVSLVLWYVAEAKNTMNKKKKKKSKMKRFLLTTRNKYAIRYMIILRGYSDFTHSFMLCAFHKINIIMIIFLARTVAHRTLFTAHKHSLIFYLINLGICCFIHFNTHKIALYICVTIEMWTKGRGQITNSA